MFAAEILNIRSPLRLSSITPEAGSLEDMNKENTYKIFGKSYNFTCSENNYKISTTRI